MNIAWRHADYHRLSSSSLPKAPGVYAILRVKRSFNIPVAASVLYVGKSKNLRQRLLGHIDPLRQHNKALNALTDIAGLEFWYSQINVADLDAVERQLIRGLSPSANVVRYANA